MLLVLPHFSSFKVEFIFVPFFFMMLTSVNCYRIVLACTVLVYYQYLTYVLDKRGALRSKTRSKERLLPDLTNLMVKKLTRSGETHVTLEHCLILAFEIIYNFSILIVCFGL